MLKFSNDNGEAILEVVGVSSRFWKVENRLKIDKNLLKSNWWATQQNSVSGESETWVECFLVLVSASTLDFDLIVQPHNQQAQVGFLVTNTRTETPVWIEITK